MTSNEKNKRRKKQKMAYTGDFAFLFSFFTLRNETMYKGSYFYFPFFVCESGKRKRKTTLSFSIFYYGFGKRKTKGRQTQHNVLFRFSFFSSCKRKNENMYNGSYFYFSFFVCGLRKRYWGTLFLFSILKLKNKKRKDGIYTDPPCFHTYHHLYNSVLLRPYQCHHIE